MSKARKLILERLKTQLRSDVLVHSIMYAPEALEGAEDAWHGSAIQIWKELWKMADEGLIEIEERGPWRIVIRRVGSADADAAIAAENRKADIVEMGRELQKKCEERDEDYRAIGSLKVRLGQVEAERDALRAKLAELREAAGEVADFLYTEAEYDKDDPLCEQHEAARLLAILRAALAATGDSEEEVETTAERIAREFGDDGTNFHNSLGQTLGSESKRVGAVKVVDEETAGDRFRWDYPDGSSITVVKTSASWDIGYRGCFCWQGAGHNDTCAALAASEEGEE